MEPGVWICQVEARSDVDDIRKDLGQEGIEAKIVLPIAHNSLTIAEEHIQW